MTTRTGELLMGLGLFALGLLALATGAFSFDGGSTASTANVATDAKPAGGIVFGEEGGQSSSTNEPASSAAPPVASLVPMGPADVPSEQEVASATLDVRDGPDVDDEDKDGDHHEDKRDKGGEPKDKRDKDDHHHGKHHDDDDGGHHDRDDD